VCKEIQRVRPPTPTAMPQGLTKYQGETITDSFIQQGFFQSSAKCNLLVLKDKRIPLSNCGSSKVSGAKPSLSGTEQANHGFAGFMRPVLVLRTAQAPFPLYAGSKTGRWKSSRCSAAWRNQRQGFAFFIMIQRYLERHWTLR
jgi:hypothetical protein